MASPAPNQPTQELSVAPGGWESLPPRLQELAKTHPWIREVSWKPDVDRVHVRVLPARGRFAKRLLSAQELVYIDAFLGGACEVPAEAARYAGYADPAAMGREVMRRLEPVIEEERAWRRANAIMGPQEVLERLSLWSKNGGELGSAVSVKATELLGRAAGVLSDKVDVRVDLDAMRVELAAVLTAPQRLIPPADDAEPAPLLSESAA